MLVLLSSRVVITFRPPLQYTASEVLSPSLEPSVKMKGKVAGGLVSQETFVVLPGERSVCWGSQKGT